MRSTIAPLTSVVSSSLNKMSEGRLLSVVTQVDDHHCDLSNFPKIFNKSENILKIFTFSFPNQKSILYLANAVFSVFLFLS